LAGRATVATLTAASARAWIARERTSDGIAAIAAFAALAAAFASLVIGSTVAGLPLAADAALTARATLARRDVDGARAGAFVVAIGILALPCPLQGLSAFAAFTGLAAIGSAGTTLAAGRTAGTVTTLTAIAAITPVRAALAALASRCGWLLGGHSCPGHVGPTDAALTSASRAGSVASVSWRAAGCGVTSLASFGGGRLTPGVAALAAVRIVLVSRSPRIAFAMSIGSVLAPMVSHVSSP